MDKKIEIKVVGIRFKEVGKIYYFDPDDLEIKAGDQVIVETVRGKEYGEAVVGPRWIGENEVNQPLRKIIRKATKEDRAQLARNRDDEREALAICANKVEEHRLPMKLVDVEYTFDRSKVIFYFTAEGRVDFRNLVKDLASVFRTRIELRQIGVRDEAKMIGGLGSCGRELCCSTFLGDFETVSIKMAKEQNLSLNPNKISGICGRLMCCLKYENATYEKLKKKMPREGTRVKTLFGVGVIDTVNLLQELIIVKFADGKREIFTVEDVDKVDKSTPLDPMEQSSMDNYARIKAASDKPREPRKGKERSRKQKPDQKGAKKQKPDQKGGRKEGPAKEGGEEEKKKSRSSRRRRSNRNRKKQEQQAGGQSKEQQPKKQDAPKTEKKTDKKPQDGSQPKKRRRRNYRGKGKNSGGQKDGNAPAPRGGNENN